MDRRSWLSTIRKAKKPMTALQASQADQDTDFVNRIKYFAVKAAVAVTTEDPRTAKHSERDAFARFILMNPVEAGRRFALVVMTNSTLFAASDFAAITDGDLEFTVNSVYNSLLS